MAWTYAYTSEIWPPLLTILLLIVLVIYAWRRRSMPGALPFMIGCLFAALWMIGSVMEYLALEEATKLFWVKFQVSCQLPYNTAITCFFLEYTWPGRWLTRRNIILLAIPPLLVLGIILTNDLHHWIWRDFRFEGGRFPLFGIGAWYWIAYAYGLAMVNIIAAAWLLIHSPQQRLPAAFLLAGLLLAYTAYLLQRTYLLQPNLLLDVLSVAVASLMYAIALFGFHIFDPIFLAHNTVIEQLQAGILVLDPQGRVVSLNPAAERIFEMPFSQVKGRLIHDLLPASSDWLIADPGGAEIDFELIAGQETRDYTLAITLLKDWRELVVGRLLLLRDITEQKQAQAQFLEQQRALATLHERERMARELHDSLGQVLGYASLQVQAVTQLSRTGQGNKAAAQLERLGEVIREAHADLREYILNLRTALSLHQPLWIALSQYLDTYTTNYDICTQLTIDPDLHEERFSPEAQLHIFRIVQEALSNARKHGKARHVGVTFAIQDGRVCLSIQDDGLGFEPGASITSDRQHYGLQIMQERAAQLGGSLRIQSAPGKGARVLLEIPAPIRDEEALYG
jgi:signal transduction histidine kinase